MHMVKLTLHCRKKKKQDLFCAALTIFYSRYQILVDQWQHLEIFCDIFSLHKGSYILQNINM